MWPPALQYMVAPTELVPTNLPPIVEPAKSELAHRRVVDPQLRVRQRDAVQQGLAAVLATLTLCEPGWRPPHHLSAASVRLVNPNRANIMAGRLEVKHNGLWGTVCDDGFSNAAATVVCRQVRWHAGHAPRRCRRAALLLCKPAAWCGTPALPTPCRASPLQLGLGTIGAAMPGGFFGEGMGKVLWLDEVRCRGDEDRLESCAHAGWGVSNW